LPAVWAVTVAWAERIEGSEFMSSSRSVMLGFVERSPMLGMCRAVAKTR